MAFCTSFVYGQDRPPRHEPPSKEEHLKQLTEKLRLTKEQGIQINSILESLKEKMDKLRENAQERKLHFEKMKMIRDEEDKKIEKILTNEQKQKFAQMKKEREKNRPPRGRRK